MPVFISILSHLLDLLILYYFHIHLEYSTTADHLVCGSQGRRDCDIWIKELEHLN